MKNIRYVKNEDEQYNIYKDYILNHMDNVRYAFKRFNNAFIDCFPAVFLDKNTREKLIKNIINHDKSKFNDIEFKPYAKHFYPISGEKHMPEDDLEYELAWLHHVNNNPHHPGYWVLCDINNHEKYLKIYDMDDIYIIEMLCDWLAMGHLNGTSLESYWNSDGKVLPMSNNTKQKVQKFIDYLKNNYITTLW